MEGSPASGSPSAADPDGGSDSSNGSPTQLGSGRTSTSTSSTTTTARTGARRDIRPPSPGRYDYDTQGSYTYDGRNHALPAVTSLVLDPPRDGGQSGVRDLRDVDGNGPSIRTTFLYAPDGIRLKLLEVTLWYQGILYVEELRPDPPPLVLPADADVGYRIDYTATTQSTTVRATAEVVGKETATVAGRPVEVYVVRGSARYEGSVVGTTEGTTRVSVEYGVVVSEDVTSELRFGAVPTEGRYRAALTRLTPAT